MDNEYQDPKYQSSNVPSVLAGLLIGGLAGAAAMLLLAPQSGKETRIQIQKRGAALRDRTNGLMEDTVTKLRSNASRLTIGAREKYQDLRQEGRDLAAGQLERLSDAAQAGKKAIESSQDR